MFFASFFCQGNVLRNSRSFDQASVQNDASCDLVDNGTKLTVTRNRAEISSEWANQVEQNGNIDGEVEKNEEAVNSVVDESAKRSFRSHLDKTVAKQLKTKAVKLWNDAWLAEENEDEIEAKSLFQKASDMFKRAFDLDLTNKEYKKLIDISKLKVEGNVSFNDGVKLEGEANELKQQQKYEDAQIKYQESLDKFQQGYRLSNDEKFKTCIEIVTENIAELSNVIETLNSRKVVIENTPQRNDPLEPEKEFTQTFGTISGFHKF